MSLESVTGVGSETADNLEEEGGIETVEQLSEAELSELTDVTGIGEEKAADISWQAKQEVMGMNEEDDVDAEVETSESFETIVIVAQDGFDSVETADAVAQIESAIQASPYAPEQVLRTATSMYGGAEVAEWRKMRTHFADDEIEMESYEAVWDNEDTGAALDERDQAMASDADAVVVVEDGDYLEMTLSRFEEQGCEVFTHIDPSADGADLEWDEMNEDVDDRSKVAIVPGDEKLEMLSEAETGELIENALDDAGLEPDVVGVSGFDEEREAVEAYVDAELPEAAIQAFRAPWDVFEDGAEAARVRDVAIAEWADDVVVVRPGEYTDYLHERAQDVGTTTWEAEVAEEIVKNPEPDLDDE